MPPERSPELPWDAGNQAAVLWYAARFGIEALPFESCAEALATFPETASRIGMRSLEKDDLLIVAPHRLDDLLHGVCRHNPTRVSARFCTERQGDTAWPQR